MGEWEREKRHGAFFSLASSTIVLGSFSNDDDDANEEVKKAIGLLNKTASWHVHHPFLYISSPLLHDYE